MGAVSVFTSEELPSPTLVQIFSFCRDVVDSWFVLGKSLLSLSLVYIWCSYLASYAPLGSI